MKTVLIANLAMAALAIGAPAKAQDISIPGDLCGKLATSVTEPLAGKWLAVNRDGGGSVGKSGVMLDDRPTQKMTLRYLDDGRMMLEGISAQGPEEMVMEAQALGQALPDTFSIQIGGKIREIDVSDLLPCAWQEMPGFVGSVHYPIPGVGHMDMKMVMNFSSKDAGFGLLHFTGEMMGREINVVRHVTMTRR